MKKEKALMKTLLKKETDSAPSSMVSGVSTGSSPPMALQPMKSLYMEQAVNLLLLVSGIVIVVMSSLLRGGHGVDSIAGVDSCSAYGWLIFGLGQVLLLGLVVVGLKTNKRLFEYHPTSFIAISSKFPNGAPSYFKITIVSYLSGVLAGTLGVGGGLVMNPLLLSIGYDPISSTAVSNLSVFFSSMSTSIQFIAVGSIHYEHAWLFTVLSFAGALTGYFILAALLRKYKRPSLVIWAILIVVVASGIVMPLELLLTINKQQIIEFGRVC